jgi:4-amino-4-deoxychorismate lyase
MLKIYCQGTIVSSDQARISAHDHGFLYGATLFETFRTYAGEPFLLSEHMARLRLGCHSYGIELPDDLLISQSPAYTKLRGLLQELLAQNGLADAVFRYTLSAGEVPGGLPTTPFLQPTELIFVRPLPPPGNGRPSRLHILTTTRTEPEVFPRPKSGHYMNSLVGLRELGQTQTEPGDEGLLLTSGGLLSEGITSNLFLISGRTLRTPSAPAHILAGITRAHLLALGPRLDLAAHEEALVLDDLRAADAIFTTNSVRGIVPIGQVLDAGGRPVWQKDSAAHGTFRRVMEAYPGPHDS